MGNFAVKPYADTQGNSGVAGFEYGTDWIDVAFKGSEVIYRYTYRSAGKAHVEEMKRLADAGDGLSTYISQRINVRYESKR